MRWLASEAQPGDDLVFAFSGYGAQHPQLPGSNHHEAYLVPCDFADDLPSNFVSGTQQKRAGSFSLSKADAGPGYRFISIIEINSWLCQLPTGCRITLIFDTCYTASLDMSGSFPLAFTFPQVNVGQIDYRKLRDYVSRPRFLDVPVLPVQHTPLHLSPNASPRCRVHSFSACRLRQWGAEFPLEGTVQGAFSWAFLKALAQDHFQCAVYEFQRTLTKILADMRLHFKGVEQTPFLQLSRSASLQDVVLVT